MFWKACSPASPLRNGHSVHKDDFEAGNTLGRAKQHLIEPAMMGGDLLHPDCRHWRKTGADISYWRGYPAVFAGKRYRDFRGWSETPRPTGIPAEWTGRRNMSPPIVFPTIDCFTEWSVDHSEIGRALEVFCSGVVAEPHVGVTGPIDTPAGNEGNAFDAIRIGGELDIPERKDLCTSAGQV